MNNIELLAPAGAMPQLKAAVQSGADAVYLGAGSFSARAGAGNFEFDALKEAVKYCHVYGVKVHCALNTLIKEDEFDNALTTAEKIYHCGVDAVIIQDLGLAAEIKKRYPDIELHGSTQMTVTSLEGVRYLEKYGFSRVVLSRELSSKEIERIVKGSMAEIEVFVHGAICMCYSGQCLMSSILGGRSGNRGRCAQPCRLKYDLSKNGEICDSAYVLSPKDMALINQLSELKRIGVSSLKIEGRLKSSEYVSAVVGVYRKYLDNTTKVLKSDMDELTNAFSRSGFTDGYFTGKLGKDMMSHENPSNNSGNTYTVEARERAEGKFVRKIPIHIFASLKKDEVLHVTAYDDDGFYAEAFGKTKAEKAQKRPLERERIEQQLVKLGETPFCTEDIIVDTDDNITIPVKEINAIRRKICDELIKKRVGEIKRNVICVERSEKKGANPTEMYLTAEVMNYEQGLAVIKTKKVKRIYAPCNVAAKLAKSESEIEIVSKTSDIFKYENINTEYVSVSSPAAAEYYGDKAKYGDFRLNIYNSYTAEQFDDFKCITLSPELNLHEIERLTSRFSGCETEIIGYGRIPLMIMKNCPIKAMGKCQHGKKIYSLKDRKNIEFPIICSDDCKAVLLNSKPIFAADIMESIKKSKINCIRLNFTVEKSEQCGTIVNVYYDAINGHDVDKWESNTFTRGHLRRGVI